MRPLSLLSVVGLALLCAPLHAATLRVPTDVSSIQAAVNRALSGDTILIQAGSYHESVTIDSRSNLRIQGEGVGKTVLDLSGASGFSLSQSDHLAFSGLTLRNAGVGFDFWECHDLIFEQNAFEDVDWAVNSSGGSYNIYVRENTFSGGQIGVHSLWDWVNDPDGTTDYLIEDNHFEGVWTGVFIDSSNHTSIRGNTFTDSLNIAIALNNWNSHDLSENLIDGGPVGLFVAEIDDEFYPPDFGASSTRAPAPARNPGAARVHGKRHFRTSESPQVRFYNNVIYQTTTAGVYAYNAPMNDTTILLRNNIFYQITGAAVYGDLGADGTGLTWNDRISITYDSFYGNDSDFGGALSSQGRRGSTHNQFRDPRFNNAPLGDFSVKPRSPAIDAGTLDVNGDGVADLTVYLGKSRDMGIEER